MKISKKWLERYMDLGQRSMDEIATTVTNAGFEVEDIVPLSQGTNLVIGEVLTCKDHPDSDHLHITTVNTGDQVRPIVCGAPNVAAGQKVIVALPGAKLPGGEIKSGKIRGEVSDGMICSLAELGVDKHTLSEAQLSGIEVLDQDAPVGHTDPLGYLGYDDTVLDIGLTPNRADCQAAWNMASETAAILNIPCQLPEVAGAADIASDVPTQLKIVSETEKCPHFYGKVVNSVTIKPSPKWMQELLRASGMNSINNVVDISNIVMLETGQPMHFYDKNALPHQEITVKDNLDTDYTTLDGETYHLQSGDVVITSNGQPIGIGGVMGGNDSKVEDNTQGIIIECASFDHVSIRNTARRLNLNTESSIRYQKGIEPLAAKKAIDRAVDLLIQYADAKDFEQTVEFGCDHYEEKTITCTVEQLNHRLGTDFAKEEIVDVFARLNLEPTVEGTTVTVKVPSTRQDLEGMADLSEEVIRMIGYDRLPSTLPVMEMTEGKLNPQQRQRRFIQTFLCENGLQDAITYTLVSSTKKENAIFSTGDALELPTPLSEERRYLRTSILPSLLESAAYNHSRGNKGVNMFEISELTSTQGVIEHLAIVLTGAMNETRWLKTSTPADFYTLKGLVETILERSGISENRLFFKPNQKDTTHFHPGRSAEVYIGKDLIGLMGEIHPLYANEVGLKHAVMAELDLDQILDAKKSKIRFTPVSKYPAVYRDLAFVVEKDLPASKIVEVIKRSGKLGKESIVKNVDVFDVYQGEHVGEHEKSIALTMTFQSDVQTLDDKTITTIFNSIIDAIVNQCKATLRSA
ncbi:phenylalanine--tRNA ligase subunit beta [Allobaculum stercoricanis]|uniref:phenylalanine--tRNA ligase subunit beta n=1 Tax=Allobaculum stercoricanis TaxID=174709 RepID=UPI0023F41151|nr:phenylalanine--tRNA ligase subunit beta [Allobaculum stercoricanis]